MDTGVAVKRSPRLDLELNGLRVHAELAEPGEQRGAHCLRVLVREGDWAEAWARWGNRGRTGRAERESLRHVELLGVTVHSWRSGRAGRARSDDGGAPHAGVREWRPRWSMIPATSRCGVGDRGTVDGQHVLGRYPSLVALKSLSDRGTVCRHLRRPRQLDQVGAEAQADVGPFAQTSGHGSGPVELGDAVERIRTDDRIARSSTASSFIGPLSEIRRGSVPFAGPPPARRRRRRRSRCPRR